MDFSTLLIAGIGLFAIVSWKAQSEKKAQPHDLNKDALVVASSKASKQCDFGDVVACNTFYSKYSADTRMAPSV